MSDSTEKAEKKPAKRCSRCRSAHNVRWDAGLKEDICDLCWVRTKPARPPIGR